MKISETVALNTFLTEYARDLDFETNLQKIVNNGESDTDIEVFESFINIPRRVLASIIKHLEEDIRKVLFKDRKMMLMGSKPYATLSAINELTDATLLTIKELIELLIKEDDDETRNQTTE